MLLVLVIAPPLRAQQAAKPLSKEQVAEFVKVRTDTTKLVQLIHDHNIDFDPSDSYVEQLRKDGAPDPVLQALRDARPKPLTRDQVLALVAQNIPSERAAALVKQRGVEFIPDDAYLDNLRLVGGTDELIAAVRAASDARTLRLRQFRGFHDPYDSPIVLFSPDGKLLAAASDVIQVLDLATGRLKHMMSQNDYNATYNTGGVRSLAFSPDGRFLASVGTIGVGADFWDVATGSLTRSLPRVPGQGSWSVAFNPDGRLLAIGTLGGEVGIYDVATGTLQQTLSPPNPNHGSVNALAFSPDGKLLVSGSSDKTVRLWDVGTGALQRTLSTNNEVSNLAFSPDGKLLASTDFTALELWDMDTGTLRPSLPGQGRNVNSVAFSPNGKLLVSGGDAIRLWDVTTGRMSELVPLAEGTTADSVAVSPDGKLLASGVVQRVPPQAQGSAILWRLKQY
jgi:WD40 repeat protein